MIDIAYVAYHVHTMLSNGTTNLDSVAHFTDYVKAAKDCGMTALGISEHGNLYEWVHKKEAIEAAGMKYLHVTEAYLTESLGDDQEEESQGDRNRYHCILIARNYDGVKEINKLMSKAANRTDGHFYYVPRITFDELFQTTDNVLITTACLGGVLHNGTLIARDKFLNFLRRNKHRCWLEIQHHNCRVQIDYNRYLYEIGKACGIPLIVGTDTHSLNSDHADARILMKAAKKKKNKAYEDETGLDLLFKTPEDLVKAYQEQKSLPMEIVYEAMQETLRMADMVEEFTLDRKAKYPRMYNDSEAVFKAKINQGVIRRGINKLPNYRVYLDRIRYEYETYKHNGAIDFMLLEEDYKSEMRRRGVRFGYSRGSASGSIIAYILGITEVDSIKYNLNFERFMNKERVSLADIDTDWLSTDRETVKDYLYEKEGLYCCDIVTFNTLALKGAIKDVCRGMYNTNMSLLPDDLRKQIDNYYKDAKKAKKKKGNNEEVVDAVLKKKIEKAYKKNAKYKDVPYDYLRFADEVIALAEQDEAVARTKYRDIFRYVDLVNGLVVSVGNHPAGCVVSPYPVDECIGTFTTSEDKYPISVLNMKEIDSLNFVKLDILGLTE